MHRIQSAYQFIDCSKENGVAVVYWRCGRIRFHSGSSHLSKQVSNLTGWALRCSYGMEGVYSLKPREYQTVTFTSGPINIVDFKAALGLA